MSESYARLEPFLLMARSTKGAAAAKIVLDAIAAPGVYHFGPLLYMPNIQALNQHEDSDMAKHYALLRLFAYGRYEDYCNSPTDYPALSATHSRKLRQVTLVSLAMESRSLPYNYLCSVLQITSIRELEDLVIDSIYAGLLAGKLNQQSGGVFSVDWVVGRDVDAGENGTPGGNGTIGLLDLQSRLQNWCKNATDLLQDIDARIIQARNEAQTETLHRNAYLADRDAVFIKYRDEAKTKKASSQRAFGSKARGNGTSEAFDSEAPRLPEEGKEKDEAMVGAGESEDDFDAPPGGGKGQIHPQGARTTRSRKAPQDPSAASLKRQRSN